MRIGTVFVLSTLATATATASGGTVVDTGQAACYDAIAEIPCPAAGAPFFGQDAQHDGFGPRYRDNGDGTVSDLITGLMWQQSPDLDGDGSIDAADKRTYEEALAGADGFSLAGYPDWRLPTIKELYSLIEFSGVDPSTFTGLGGARPFIDTDAFAFAYGDTTAGERIIDAQFASSTLYVSTTMGGNRTMFGVNFADGRIKGYPANGKGFYVLYVRGGDGYGVNDFVDNGDGTVTDRATGFMWAQEDSGTGMDWEAALAWVARLNAERFLGYGDWRVPNAKELQSLVDYSRSPDTTGSAAIDPVFHSTEITNEAGQLDYPFYWSSTTHLRDGPWAGEAAVYVAFGRAMGCMNGRWTDVHGAGAQRSDPKVGDAADYPRGRGPQGDAIRIANFVRPVRDVGPTVRSWPLSAVVTGASSSGDTALAPLGAPGGTTALGPTQLSGLGGTIGARPIEPTGRPSRAHARSEPGAPRRPMRPPVEAALDADGDGALGAFELAAAPRALAALDANGDGRLTRDECLPPPPPGAPAGTGWPQPPLPLVLTALDADGDGTVSAAERSAAALSLAALDRDHDGRLSPDEYRPRSRQRPDPGD